MKRQSIVRSFDKICPDEEARERMLQNILLSSEISPEGKDKRYMRKKMRPMLIAAIISLMILLMGCAIVAMKLEDVKIGQNITRGEILDSQGNVLIEKDVPQDIISIHGLKESPAYLAQQEWFEFEKNYDPNYEILFSVEEFDVPDAYSAYNPYTQDMVDKIDEIVAKYDLKLLGPLAVFQRWEYEIFQDCLNIESLVVSDEKASVTNMSGYFYEGGNFNVEFNMEMADKEHSWPNPMLNSLFYSRKDYFDDTTRNVHKTQWWDQWNYTTESGYDVLIASSRFGAIAICDKVDSVIYVNIENTFGTDWDDVTGEYATTITMTKEQLEEVVDQIDFSIEVESVDMDLAKEQLEQFANME